MDKKGKRNRFERAQKRKRDASQLSEIQKLKQQVEGLQKQLSEQRDPLKQKIEQLEVQLKDANKDIQHLNLKLSTKAGQVDFYATEIGKLKSELQKYMDAENVKEPADAKA